MSIGNVAIESHEIADGSYHAAETRREGQVRGKVPTSSVYQELTQWKHVSCHNHQLVI